MSIIYTTLLKRIYDPAIATKCLPRLKQLIQRYQGRIHVPADTSLSQHDAILITYGDQVQQTNKTHLQSLTYFCQTHLQGVISGIHLLPFFPWSSDDGFSVKDYRLVDPKLGNWQDIERLGSSFRLMFDGVINHASAQGTWFQAFLHSEPPFCDYFLTVEGDPDLSQVVRPRALPLLTDFETSSGRRRVWTTFSADQVDLDYHNPDVLLEILDILLMYAKRGAQFLRLDAIAYLWKEIGTSCIHLPQTHAIVQLLRAVLNEAAPHVRLITETNVPHSENVAYFGNGQNEAQLVYNFALPPLVLHTFRTADSTQLSAWAATLELPSKQTTFFNFLASHDGIGLNPARGILPLSDIEALVEQTRQHGGLISYKRNADGSQSPYELNINYFDALSNPESKENLELQVNRFLASQAIMLSLQGLPGIYFHSLFGSRNWLEGVQITHHNRTINRQKLDLQSLDRKLAEPGSLRAQVFSRYCDLLTKRSTCAAFHPHGDQKILDLGNRIFALLRTSPDGKEQALCLQNVTAEPQTAAFLGERYHLEAYQTRWIAHP